MRWNSWLPRSRPHRLSVVGLDIGPEVCGLVVLSGSPIQPVSVCCAERLELPEGLVAHGEVLQSGLCADDHVYGRDECPVPDGSPGCLIRHTVAHGAGDGTGMATVGFHYATVMHGFVPMWSPISGIGGRSSGGGGSHGAHVCDGI